MVGISRLVITSLLLICAASAEAAVSAHLSAQTIDELETVRLQIKITETRQTSALDLSELEDDFHIMNTNTMSQSRYINGRGQSWVDYTITLQPKRTGVLQIPSIRVGTEQTPTLTLRVNPLTDETRRKIDELVFFETELSSEEIYVQAQLVLTRRLLYSQGVQLYSDLPGAPEIKDAVVLTLGETTSGTTERDGRSYGVVEQRYAIFPEASGSFTVPGIGITASVRLLEGGRVSRKGVRVTTEARDVRVLPVPADYPADEPWLPAENVELIQVVTPEETRYSVGDPLTHELLISIEGNIGSIAAPQELPLDDNQFRIYPQAPTINDDTVGETVLGARLQTSSLIPLVPGQLEVPPARVVWWDTLRDRMRIAEAPAISMLTAGNAVASSPSSQDEPVSTAAEPDAAAEAPLSTNLTAWRSWVAATAVFGLFVVMLVYVMRRRPPASHPQTERQPTSGNPRSRLDSALKQGDADEINRLLPDVLAQRLGTSPTRAIALAGTRSPGFADAYRRLQASLYGAQPAPLTAADFQALSAALDLTADAPAKTHNAPLPPLYPA